MDYEQKYKEALERARELKNKLEKSCSLATPTGIESIFPELAESEDEKVRKEMIDFLQETIDNVGASPNKWTMYNAKKWIAWLEKQGEQKQKQYDIDVFEKHITKDSISDLAHTIIVRNGWEIVDAKEQKPAWSEEDKKMVETICKEGDLKPSEKCWFKSLPERFNLYSKQEWGKEDEKIRKELIDRFKSLKPNFSWYEVPINSILAWLEKQGSAHLAWSEEDKKQLERAIYMMEQLNMTKSWDDVYNWLKSLKPQPHWKPTEEQLNALYQTSKNDYVMYKATLTLLYNDLKKL